MMDLDTLRQDIERNTLYPYGVSMEYRDGTKAEAGIENGRRWNCTKRTP